MAEHLGREVGVDRQPAELQDAHEEAGHEEPALHAVRRSAHDGQRQARLHSHHSRRKIEEEVADQGSDHYAKNRRAEPLGQDAAGVGGAAVGTLSQNTNQSMIPA